MAEINATFSDINIECAKRFLQHAVVVDNGLFFVGADEIQEAGQKQSDGFQFKRPGKRSPKAGGVRADVKAETNDNVEYRRELNAQQLVESFAEKHILCCPYRPESAETEIKVVETTLSVARNADIVVLDWDLGGGGKKATEVVRRLINDDNLSGGRLRLIAIYTVDKDVHKYYRDVAKALKIELPDEEPNNYILIGAHFRIVFINKANLLLDPIPGVKKLSESEICDYLINEFAQITDGLMPNIALNGISAIREATHHILAKYTGKLDPALLTHRVLLADPHEAEDFVVQLIADEFATILQTGEVGSASFGLDCIKAWIEDRAQNRNLKFGIESPVEDRYSASDAFKLVASGYKIGRELLDKRVPPEQNPKFSKSFLEKIQSKVDVMSNLFSSSNEERDFAHQSVARFSILAREAYGRSHLPPNWAPVLSLGSIVKTAIPGKHSEYYVCVQPVCDSVRVDVKGQNFPFIRLFPVKNPENASSYYDLIVVYDPKGSVLHLKPSYKPMNQALFKFAASDKKGLVRAKHIEGKTYKFEDTDGQKYLWLGDMKTVFAIRDADRISGQLRRIGMSEFEWLRMRSSF